VITILGMKGYWAIPILVGIAVMLSMSTMEPVFANHTPPFTGTTGHCNLTMNAPLPNAFYTNCNLSGVDFSDLDLTSMFAPRADFSGADFSGAILITVQLGDADLTGADLSGANLFQADLSGADLTGVNFGCPSDCPQITRARLASAQGLSGADLSGIQLFQTSLEAVDLTGTDLSGANLFRTDFTNADLTNANLVGADMSGAFLTSAKIIGTDLSGANLQGARYNSDSIIFGTLGGTTCGTGTLKVGNQCEVDPSIAQQLANALAALAAALAQITALEDILESGEITICHEEDNTKTIPLGALSGHLVHGDTLGPC